MISTAVWVQGSFAASSSSAADDVFTSAGFATLPACDGGGRWATHLWPSFFFLVAGGQTLFRGLHDIDRPFNLASIKALSRVCDIYCEVDGADSPWPRCCIQAKGNRNQAKVMLPFHTVVAIENFRQKAYWLSERTLSVKDCIFPLSPQIFQDTQQLSVLATLKS